MARVQLPNGFVRFIYRWGFALARCWWWLRRPHHHGALVAIWVDGHVLLLQSSYRRRLNFPGGGAHAGESPIATARRELREELGVDLPEAAFGPAKMFHTDCDNRHCHDSVFVVHLPRRPVLRLDNREIVGAVWLTAAEAAQADLPPTPQLYVQSVRASGTRTA